MIRIAVCSIFFLVTTGQNVDFPANFAQDMASMVLEAIDVAVSGCKINPSNIQYIYYNRQNPVKPILLDSKNLEQTIPKIPTKIVLHGWFGSSTGPSAYEIKKAYLKRGNYNLLFVNWERYATVNYAQAICSLALLGEVIGDFIYDLYIIAKLELNSMHLIGHSLGAHLAGYVGQRIQYRTDGQKLFRITGLDAAGPGFLGFPEESRLDASDAYFVDAIHTNGAQFGYPTNYGNVDFYPNCGLFQPGCLHYDMSNNITILKQTLDNLECSHNRSVEYFIESINSEKFMATRYQSCSLLQKCSTGPMTAKTIMGEDCPISASGSYCLVTNPIPPYARGT